MALVKGQRYINRHVKGILEVLTYNSYRFHWPDGVTQDYSFTKLDEELRKQEWILCESDKVISILQHYPE